MSLHATNIELDSLTKKELEDVGNEFAVNFSHTAVAAPETDDSWGVEVGLVAGQTGTPKLKKTINESGGDGSDFENLYTAGLMARVHIPFDFFFEASLLPEREISDVSIANRTFALGWNLGAFLGLPLDLTLGANISKSDVSFNQLVSNGSTDVDSKIDINASSNVLWVGASKTFLFFTPYVKIGTAKTEADVKVNASNGGTIFSSAFSSNQKESVSSSGGYMALGANLQFTILRFGVEASQTIDVKRVAGKFSIAF